jgi:PhnB protein
VTAQVETVSPDDSWARLSEPGYAAAMREAQETLDVELSSLPTGRASAPVAPTQRGPDQP